MCSFLNLLEWVRTNTHTQGSAHISIFVARLVIVTPHFHIVDLCHTIQYPATLVVDESIALPDTTANAFAESSQHRSARMSRQLARGIVTAEKLGYSVPSKDVSIAPNHFITHHGVAPATGLQCCGKRSMYRYSLWQLLDIADATDGKHGLCEQNGKRGISITIALGKGAKAKGKEHQRAKAKAGGHSHKPTLAPVAGNTVM